MPEKSQHFAIKFASRFASTPAGFLNAWTALVRLDALIEDAEGSKELFDRAHPESDRWYPWCGAEVFSYYAVGFVTCLEWHARSRLSDLLAYMPAAARSEDIRIVKDKLVLEMLEANVTIASVVAASTSVNSLDDYMNVFARLLSRFEPGLDGFKAIKAERAQDGTPWVSENEIIELRELYDFRHMLVHEIGIERIGHTNVRERWDPSEAIRIGGLVRRVIKGIEAQITAKLPLDFPNLLTEQGIPASEIDRLEREIPMLEARIELATTAFTDAQVDEDPNWPAAKAAAAEYLLKERRFLEEASMLHDRYLELRVPAIVSLLKSRHSYLTNMLEIVGENWQLDLDVKV